MTCPRTSSSDSAASGAAGPRRVGVLLPLPLAAAYDYRLAEGMTVPAGSFVRVPLGRREVTGVVWGAAGGRVAEDRLREVRAGLDAPPFGEPLRRFIDWVAGYTLAPPGAVLRMAMSVPGVLDPPRPRIAYREGGRKPTRMTAARARVFAELAAGPPRTATELARAAGVSPSVVRGLAAAGALEAVALASGPVFAAPDWRRAGPALSPDQAAAAEVLGTQVAAGGFAVTLLDGVNGAGKTEVYFAAIAAALERGRQALVLLPEIALTAQWLARFAARFGVRPAEWHSELTAAQRRTAWRAVATGEARVLVGARSALFLPFPELGLIVVDEEHDASFKQEDGVIYHARDMAVVRARFENVPVILSSATPSLETVVNAENGRYRRLHLPDRHGGAGLPRIEAVDMRRERLPASRWLSPALTAALEETFAAGEQAMLFLNRRGFAPLTLCRACGHRLGCPNCSAWLVEHRRLGRLQCHHCGHAMRLPDACPACGAEHRFAACGPGVERLAEEVAAAFPSVRRATMASDTVSGPRAAAELVRRMTAREIDLLIGTQIVAKGHHFPLLTLVGVIDADLGLAGGDLRASERTYQLLHQVAGRAGRAERPGRVLLQTYMPDHPVMAALIAGDRDRFLANEAADRRARGMPPFGRLAAVIVSGPSEAAARALARELRRRGPQGDGIEVLGPAPAPLALLRGRYRYRLLLKAPRKASLQRILRAWLGEVEARGGLRLQIDVDPYSFL
ncbi:MAG: primosomal protein N' [Alphaproteobacteria bacterium]